VTCLLSLLFLSSAYGMSRKNVERHDVKHTGAEGFDAAVKFAEQQLTSTMAAWSSAQSVFPDFTSKQSGQWISKLPQDGGAGGYLAGSCWAMYRLTGNAIWRQRALEVMATLRTLVDETTLGYELGNLLYPALRSAYELDDDEESRKVHLQDALNAASTMARLFVRIPGVMKSWTNRALKDNNMLDVHVSVESLAASQLLIWAADLPGGTPAWKDMAISNARRAARNQLRADGGIHEVLTYIATSATAVPKSNSPAVPRHLRFSTSSPTQSATAAMLAETMGAPAWGRGQALYVLGMTAAYRARPLPELLTAARTAAGFLLSRLPADGVPTWDLSPAHATKGVAVDTSAAAVAALALSDLGALVTSAQPGGASYSEASNRITTTLATKYLSKVAASTASLPETTSASSSGTLDAKHLRGSLSSLFSSISAQVAKLTGEESAAPAPPSSVLLGGVDSGAAAAAGVVNIGTMVGDYYFLESLVRLHTAGGAKVPQQ